MKVPGTSPDDDPGALRPAFARPAAMQAPPRNRLARAPAIAPIREADEEPAPRGMIPPRKASPRDDPEAADDAPARPISPLALPAPDERHIRRGAGAPRGAVGGGSKPHFAAPRPSRAPAPRGRPRCLPRRGSEPPARAREMGRGTRRAAVSGLVGGPFDERAAAASAAAANAAAPPGRGGYSRGGSASRRARTRSRSRGMGARRPRRRPAGARSESRPPDFALKRDAGPRPKPRPPEVGSPLESREGRKLGGDAVIARLKAAANRAEAAELDRLGGSRDARAARVGLFDAASPLRSRGARRRGDRRDERIELARRAQGAHRGRPLGVPSARGAVLRGQEGHQSGPEGGPEVPRAAATGPSPGGPSRVRARARTGGSPSRARAELRVSVRDRRVRATARGRGRRWPREGEGDRRGAPSRIRSRRAPRRGPSRTLATRVREFITYHHRVRGELDRCQIQHSSSPTRVLRVLASFPRALTETSRPPSAPRSV